VSVAIGDLQTTPARGAYDLTLSGRPHDGHGSRLQQQRRQQQKHCAALHGGTGDERL